MQIHVLHVPFLSRQQALLAGYPWCQRFMLYRQPMADGIKTTANMILLAVFFFLLRPGQYTASSKPTTCHHSSSLMV